MDSTFACCAYCWKNEDSWDKLLCFKCDSCQKRVHYDCIHSPQPSPLLGDTFFNYKCEACGEGGKEEFVRSSMSWHNVVMLTLYNLHKTSQGRCGYFHWKSHVGAFIDQHWTTFFGYQRKKTTVWLGTVAGILSIGCPEYFLSGTHVGQQGHWRLTEVTAPLANAEKKKNSQKKKMKEPPMEIQLDKRKCRRVGESVLSSAVDLKEKWSTLQDTKECKRQKHSQLEDNRCNLSNMDGFSATSAAFLEAGTSKAKKSGPWNLSVKKEPVHSIDFVTNEISQNFNLPSSMPVSQSVDDQCPSQSSLAPWPSTRNDMTAPWDEAGSFDDLMMMANDDDDNDIHLKMLVAKNSADPRPPSPDVDVMLRAAHSSYKMSDKFPVPAEGKSLVPAAGKSLVPAAGKSLVQSVKTTTREDMSDTESECLSENNIKYEPMSDSEGDVREEPGSDEERENMETADGVKQEVDKAQAGSGERKQFSRPHKRRKCEDTFQPSPVQHLQRISLFEEGELLHKLNDAANKHRLQAPLAQLRRKLICNQTNREFGLPVFDLENQMNKLAKLDRTAFISQEHPSFQYRPARIVGTRETRDLDRFMISSSSKKLEARPYTTFYQRLVGLAEHELSPVVSPYTTRVLLPFIWRNFDLLRKPLKLKLLQEIQAHPHRNDSSWVPPQCSPIDYCYMRPEHVPSVNALCREFFWPGIDVSECLQYPDFSCVVLYRKIVIAFAFMVPDRGYNEAYISFIFTHPEWRGAGIATFMLYHLIQTCMGKDVLLHVSATNPAMLLYQKFGFKSQELIFHFYHKYFPLNSKESTHAFLMRLSR